MAEITKNLVQAAHKRVVGMVNARTGQPDHGWEQREADKLAAPARAKLTPLEAPGVGAGG